jgi:hypothetical protein
MITTMPWADAADMSEALAPFGYRHEQLIDCNHLCAWDPMNATAVLH